MHNAHGLDTVQYTSWRIHFVYQLLKSHAEKCLSNCGKREWFGCNANSLLILCKVQQVCDTCCYLFTCNWCIVLRITQWSWNLSHLNLTNSNWIRTDVKNTKIRSQIISRLDTRMCKVCIMNGRFESNSIQISFVSYFSWH